MPAVEDAEAKTRAFAGVPLDSLDMCFAFLESRSATVALMAAIEPIMLPSARRVEMD